MPDTSKSEKILDALQQLLNEKSIQHISPFTRMAMLFHACQNFSVAFLKQNYNAPSSIQDMAVLHQKYLNYVISELKPALTEIISQAIASGEVQFDRPAALAEVVLIVLAVKLDNSLVPSTHEEATDTLKGLIELLEKGTNAPAGTFDYLSLIG